MRVPPTSTFGSSHGDAFDAGMIVPSLFVHVIVDASSLLLLTTLMPAPDGLDFGSITTFPFILDHLIRHQIAMSVHEIVALRYMGFARQLDAHHA